MATSYSKEEYELAKTVSCFDYLVAKGYEVERQGNSHNLKIHDSLVLFADGGFKWFSRDVSGNAITLLNELEGKPLNEAIKELAEFTQNYVRSPTDFQTVKGHGSFTPKEKEEISKTINTEFDKKEKIEFVLPDKNTSTKKIREYLTETRKLSSEVVDYAITNNLVYQDKNGNCIFVGYDENKEPKSATLRGTYEKVFRYDIDESSKKYGFSSLNKNSNKLYIFESAIDSLSLMSINKSFDDNYLSLNGTALIALEDILKNNPNIDTIITCLDNDTYGQKATKKIWDMYKDSYTIGNYSFFGKDINEQLILDTVEPKIIITESNIDTLQVGDVLSFSEVEKVINNSSNYFVQSSIMQGEYELSDSIMFSDTTDEINSFEKGIEFSITQCLDGIKSIKADIPKLTQAEKLELNNQKLKVFQLNKCYTNYKQNEQSKSKENDKLPNKTNNIRQKIGESEKKVSTINNSISKENTQVMER